MKKRLIAAVTGLLLAVSLLPSAAAAQKHEVPEEFALSVLRELRIMVGDGLGDLMLERAVTRAEFAKMLVTASPYKDSVSTVSSTSPFRDVPGSHWAAGYIKLAVEQGWLTGYLDGTYQPDQSIKLEEAVTGALKLLGYTAADFSGAFPYAQLSLGDSLGLLERVTATEGTVLTRRNLGRLFYNTLVATGKDGKIQIAALGHAVTASGEVDLEKLMDLEREGPVAVADQWESALPYPLSDCLIYRNDARAEATSLEDWDVVYWSDEAPILWAYSDKDIMDALQSSIAGPIVAASGWASSLPFDAAAATFMKNGKSAAYSDIQTEDVLYYSKQEKTVYAYSAKVTGMIEAIAPSAVSPTSVTLGGKSYTLETNGVKYAFSDLGTLRVGDTATLLLGRTGAVAGISGRIADTDLSYGLVTAIGTGTYADDSGGSYTTDTITVTTTAGASAVYPYTASYLKTGDLVSLTHQGGAPKVTRLTTASLSGKFSSDGTTFAGYALAADAELLDIYGTSALRVYPSRLAGVSTSSVLYYATNTKGELTHLILSDVTGDHHQYGVLTSVKESGGDGGGESLAVNGSYQYDIGGVSGSYNSSTKKYGAATGPFVLKKSGNTVDSIKNLTSVTLTALSSSTATAGSSSYSLSDHVLVYRYSGGNYYLTSLAAVQGGEYTLTGWYDKPEASGGRIRVILAK